MRIAWVAALLAACAEPRTTRCGDLVCPVEKTCDAHRLVCILPSQRDACEGLAQGDACSFPGELAGTCDTGVCHPIVCGNGVRELDEACDDANTAGGDGCSADCRSDERCGNTIVDVDAGEECDDGGFASHDGCSSACRVEVVTWAELAYPNTLRGTAHAMVYDAARDRIVRFGGLTPTAAVVGTTFEWSGAQRVWARIALPGPTPRSGHAMVYDAHRRRTIVFGGGGGGGDTRLGDTWSYDGAAWTKLAPSAAPAARRGTAAAYDAARDRIVLFGGDTASGLAGDTWELDGDQWIALAPAVAPPARRDHRMAYDAARARVVLVGGSATGPLADTWEWDGTSWQQVTTAVTAPSARGAIAYDAERAAVVLFGGTGNTPRSETWEYRGVDWVLATPAAEPPPRVGMAMAYDALRRRLVMSSGGPAVLGADYDDLWEYDGATWTSIDRVEAPPRRNNAGFAYDPRAGHHVMFGGYMPPSTLRDDTWVFDGVQWIPRAPLDAPTGAQCPMGPCPAAGMVWAAGRQRFVYLRQGAGGLETWELVGDAWNRLVTTGAPPSRRLAAMAYDPVRDRVVLFGGEASPGAPFGDTWELAGSTWTQVITPVAPSARNETAMTWDARRQRIVLFGGRTAAGAVADTWEYDGAWTPITPTASPPPRGGVGMTYHARRGTVVIFGGEAGPMPSTQVWEYDGTTWTLIDVARGPQPRKSPHFSWSPALAGILLAGGDPREDTWELQWRSATPDEQCDDGADQDGDGLVDCADPDCEEAACGPGARCRAQTCACAGGAAPEVVCGDGFDDDCDGLVDCADPDCAALAPCTAEAACDDGADDDGDQRSDCADPGCAGLLVCEAIEASCGDGVDNDGDGRADCQDLDCFLVACAAVVP